MTTEDLTKKELYSLKIDEFVKNDFLDDIFSRELKSYLNVHTHQLFCRNFFNPDAARKALILEHGTGTGKTLAACVIIMEFIKTYIRMYAAKSARSVNYGLEKISELETETPYVLILGFEGTQDAFFREFTTYPEFGFVTPIEREQYIRLKNSAERDSATVDDTRRFREMYLKFRKRLTDKTVGGFMAFKGFQELVNTIFEVKDPTFKLDDIDKIAAKTGQNESDIFAELINNGTLKPRLDNINKYTNSLIVADELHNTYNSSGKNSRGIVLQYLIDHVPGIRFLGLSATLLNSSPAEFVEVLNYVLVDKVKREDYFGANGVFLRQSVPKELGTLSHGYFSFLQDNDPKYYPRVIKAGEPYRIDGKELPYIRFNEVPMSKDLQRAHEMVIEVHGTDETGRIKVPIGSEMVFDMTLPVPRVEGTTDEEKSKDSKKSEHFDYIPGVSNDALLKGLQGASHEFLAHFGLNISRDTEGLRISGPILHVSELEKWSPKYAAMIKMIDSVNGKCVIFHKKVRGSGVIMIEEILRANGYIGDGTDPVSDTKCAVCGHILAEHKVVAKGNNTEKIDHEFVPARYLLVYGGNKPEIPGYLQKYNSALNTNGLRYKILIGSKVIRESYDFKDVRHMAMVNCPDNISMLMQIYGRAVRTNSHALSDPVDKNVTIHTFLSTINKSYPSTVPVSAEAQRYQGKLNAYLLIQLVDAERHANAVDANINRGTIFPRSKESPDGKPKEADFGALYFEPVDSLSNGLELKDLRTDTFKAHGHFKNEINTLIMIIKRLFIMHRVWTYEALWKATLDPPFPVEINYKLFDESLFAVALTRLVDAPNLSDTADNNKSMAALVNRLVDPSERRIGLESGQYKIIFAMGEIGETALGETASPPKPPSLTGNTGNTGKKTGSIGYYILVPCSPNGEPIIDVDIYVQGAITNSKRIVSLSSFISSSYIRKRYNHIRDSIVYNYAGKTDIDDFAEFLMGYPQAIQELFIQDCIMMGSPFTTKRVEKDFRSASELIMAGLGALGALVTVGEVKTYRAVEKYYPGGLKGQGGRQLTDETVIGYESTNSIKLLINADTFTDVAKSVFNRHEMYRENEIIIGYLEDSGTDMKFKLRKSSVDVMKLMEESKDGRSIERGIVCNTKTKEQLTEIMTALGVKVGTARVKNFCKQIFLELLTREIEARSSFSKTKYCYYWWDRVPKASE
jgi:hypothetical protein